MPKHHSDPLDDALDPKAEVERQNEKLAEEAAEFEALFGKKPKKHGAKK